MSRGARLNGLFVLEGLNGLSTTYYFYYLYFFTREHFGFGRMENLLLAASLGLIYMISSLQGGRFGQRHGYIKAFQLGAGLLSASLFAGAFLTSLAGHAVVVVVATVGTCLTWPTLEAMVCHGASPAELPRRVGLYNVVWAVGGAAAFFSGGLIRDTFGPRSLFLLPAAIAAMELLLAVKLGGNAFAADPESAGPAPVPPAQNKKFLGLAWWANPFAYLGINTVLALMPSLATKLQLTTGQAGLAGSLWMFVRALSFFGLWQWPGWHYRFGWLAAAFLSMAAGFMGVLLSPNLALLIIAQVFLGAGLGVIYYSSLFYSMDAGEAKSEHGGIHEAAIGLGNCVGPAVGAGALYFFPASGHAAAWAVAIVLSGGFAGLVWRRGRG